MVHGTDLLVRYVLVSKRPIDKYSHLMDIMKNCRHDLTLTGNGKKIIVFDGYELRKRFDKLPSSRHILENVVFEYVNLSDFDTPRGSFEPCDWSPKLQKTSGDIHGWFDIFLYSTRKFSMHEDMAKFNEDEWRRLSTEVEKDPLGDVRKARDEMTKTARLIHMHKNPEYLAKIQELDAAMTAPLTEEEQSVLERVRSAPELRDNIQAEGFEMYTYSY